LRLIGDMHRAGVAMLAGTDANPLQDITNTQRIDAVVSNGRFLPRSALDNLLANVATIVRREVPTSTMRSWSGRAVRLTE
jgi:hypothetical protein